MLHVVARGELCLLTTVLVANKWLALFAADTCLGQGNALVGKASPFRTVVIRCTGLDGHFGHAQTVARKNAATGAAEAVGHSRRTNAGDTQTSVAILVVTARIRGFESKAFGIASETVATRTLHAPPAAWLAQLCRFGPTRIGRVARISPTIAVPTAKFFASGDVRRRDAQPHVADSAGTAVVVNAARAAGHLTTSQNQG